jgi:diacylglycerol kinase family enzyme
VSLVSGEEIIQAARRALDAGASIVVAGGGDGTISTVASVVAGTNVALGVLPIGTLNHFAKDLHIPLNPAEAAQTVISGRTIPVDVGDLNGRTFINNASIGLYPRWCGSASGNAAAVEGSGPRSRLPRAGSGSTTGASASSFERVTKSAASGRRSCW